MQGLWPGSLLWYTEVRLKGREWQGSPYLVGPAPDPIRAYDGGTAMSVSKLRHGMRIRKTRLGLSLVRIAPLALSTASLS